MTTANTLPSDDDAIAYTNTNKAYEEISPSDGLGNSGPQYRIGAMSDQVLAGGGALGPDGSLLLENEEGEIIGTTTEPFWNPVSLTEQYEIAPLKTDDLQDSIKNIQHLTQSTISSILPRIA